VTLNLWLMHWLLSARAFFAVGGEDGFEAAREHVRGRDFWVVRDPARPSVPRREARGRRVFGYQILVEVGLEDELPQFVRTVGTVLEDPRGWQAAGIEFVPVERNPRLSIMLARPRTVDRLCWPLRTGGEYSCGRKHRAALNLDRWREGAEPWGDEVAGYRVYMVNHEVGHLIGMPHAECDEPGQPAAVMLQQTMGLEGCEAQPWPLESELDHLHSRWHRD
jgi:hypothetical protein